MATKPQPTNLIQAVQYLSDPDLAFDFVRQMRWPDGPVVCPRCNHKETWFISTRRIWKCKGCKKQFSLKVGTIFEDSPLGWDKWLPAAWLIANSKNGVSSHELGRALGVTQKTAWFMLHRIRHAMATKSFAKLDGTVEVDETYVGGQAKFMHGHLRAERIHGTGGVDKVAIQGAVQRGGPVVAKVVATPDRTTLQSNVRAWVESGATVYTDEAHSLEQWVDGARLEGRAGGGQALGRPPAWVSGPSDPDHARPQSRVGRDDNHGCVYDRVPGRQLRNG